VDGDSLGEEDSIVLRDRKVLAEDGMCIVVMTVDQVTGTITNGPEIIPRGFAYGNEIGWLMEEGRKAVVQALSDPAIFQEDWQVVKTVIRKSLTGLFFKKTKRRPLIIPIVIDND
jgi:ribonuclease J